ncbi:MAG: cellulase family glycosylhydrolase [Paludibacteraceae bacterium]|nr:cellulase family glycosylhydrolase [Paludibacteraceae bacterium]
MKKILSLAAVASMAVAANAQDNFIEKWGQLKLVGNQLSSASGEAIQLKGWSTFSLHYGEVQGCLGSNQWEIMKQYGANVVRLAMYVDETDSYLSNPSSWKKTVKQYIDQIADKGMYCLVDWHVLETNGHSGNPNDHINESKDFFKEISSYCKDKGYKHVLYEICNEPTCGWGNIKTYAESVIPVILDNQPNAIVIVGTDSWCQKITEPINQPLNSKFKNNVMYSFHYYSCAHFNLLGDFRGAQKSIPVFVSEWSAVNFDGDGPMCESNGDALIADCEKTTVAPQLVSWCIWNWGKKNEASSTFKNECKPENLSKFDGSKSNAQVGEYAVKLMKGFIPDIEMPEVGPYEVQEIPNSEDNAWMWAYYDFGGEGYAYHDGNGSAYKKDDEGEYLDYKIGDECDAFSQAYKMQLLKTKAPWYTVSADGKTIESYQKDVECSTWDNKISYLSLNAGKKYAGVAGSGRPDEGVDLASASLLGTPLKYKGYNNLCMVEENEWVNYTVNVAEKGYYKVSAYVSAECEQGGLSFSQERGNITRSQQDLGNKEDYTAIHFEKPASCADASIDRVAAPWDCWGFNPGLDIDDEESAVVVFVKDGVQDLKVQFNAPAGGIGPLVFTKLPDAIVPAEFDANETISAAEFTIAPNPTSGEFTVTLAEAGKAQVEVVNVAGQVVYSAEIEGAATINKALAAGVYSVVVKSNGGVNTQKLVVK